jgi:hypothetical protein
MLDDIMAGSSAVRQSKTILAPYHSHPNGTAALGKNTTGDFNTAVGDGALNNNIAGSSNTLSAFGFPSMSHRFPLVPFSAVATRRPAAALQSGTFPRKIVIEYGGRS